MAAASHLIESRGVELKTPQSSTDKSEVHDPGLAETRIQHELLLPALDPLQPSVAIILSSPTSSSAIKYWLPTQLCMPQSTLIPRLHPRESLGPEYLGVHGQLWAGRPVSKPSPKVKKISHACETCRSRRIKVCCRPVTNDARSVPHSQFTSAMVEHRHARPAFTARENVNTANSIGGAVAIRRPNSICSMRRFVALKRS